MQYLFVFTLLLNICALGYFLFAHEELTGVSPQVTAEMSQISEVVSVTKK